MPTPIGNLEDITLRAIRVLGEVDAILSEDTRRTAVLLRHYDISTPAYAYHAHNEHKITEHWADRIENERLHVAVVSDAGTPCLSDPGYMLVRECVARGVGVEALPGATAITTAVVSSGIAPQPFLFYGFLPTKGKQNVLSRLYEMQVTIILYESPFRLVKTLQIVSAVMGERRVAVCRELTKMNEEIARGTAQELVAHFSEKKVKGEIVIVISKS